MTENAKYANNGDGVGVLRGLNYAAIFSSTIIYNPQPYPVYHPYISQYYGVGDISEEQHEPLHTDAITSSTE